MRWNSKGSMVILLGFVLSTLVYYLGIGTDIEMRLLTIGISILVTILFTVLGVVAGQRWDHEDAKRTLQMNLAAFAKHGIPEKAVHHMSDGPNHFFGVAIDLEKWLLYLLDSRNAGESEEASQRMRTYSFSDIDHVASNWKPLSRTSAILTGQSHTYGYSKKDYFSGTTLQYKYDTVRHRVGHELHLHLNSGKTDSYVLSPSKQIYRSYSAEQIIEKLQEAMNAYTKLHPRVPEEPVLVPEKNPYMM